jgi:hypothetical protein
MRPVRAPRDRSRFAHRSRAPPPPPERIGIFGGYAAYYLVRNNLALAIPDILKIPSTRSGPGWALTGLSIAHGISKFLMGSVSDGPPEAPCRSAC